MDSYITVKNYSRFEFEDRKSRFIGEAAPVATETEAIDFIEGAKKKYPDASHHVYAYVLKDNSIMRFSDDREPQGTAGMPVLDVIRKGGAVNVVIVVTRYFGGTLLGTGGLVRAYTAAAQGAFKSAQIITYDVYLELKIECSYSDYQKLTPVFSEFDFYTIDTRYAENIEIIGKIVKTSGELFLDKLIQVTSGRAKSEIISEMYDFL